VTNRLIYIKKIQKLLNLKENIQLKNIIVSINIRGNDIGDEGVNFLSNGMKNLI